jgi:hypothetical protein
MGMSRVSVAAPRLSPILVMAAASFVAGMLLPAGLLSTKYTQLRSQEEQHRGELVQVQTQLLQAQHAQAQYQQRLQEVQEQLSTSLQELKTATADRAVQPLRQAPPSSAVAQASAAAAAATAALAREKALAMKAQHDNDTLRLEVRDLRAKVGDLTRTRKAKSPAPTPLAPHAEVAKPEEHPQPAQHVALAATDAAAVGIRALAPGMVQLANGERVLIGQRFPSGETLLGVDPGSDEVRTNKRTLLLFFKR